MMKIALLQCYSSNNLGDGLLVEEAIELLEEAFGDNIEVTIAASYPETFAGIGSKRVRSRPTLRGYDPNYLNTLAKLHTFDLVVGVGGGYLRFGGLKEAAKTSLVMLPQVVAAATRATRSIYLPQSVGPAAPFLRRPLETLFSRIDCFLVRDDRSIEEFPSAGFQRFPDVALLSSHKRDRDPSEIHPTPVYSIRAVHGRVPDRLLRLSSELGQYDGYIQSTGAGNDDTEAMSHLDPQRLLSAEDFSGFAGPRRVVVAVRLHAALMALNAGHYVVHLAYERKGFGAFQDLDLTDFVHSVNSFDVDLVAQQVGELLRDRHIRSIYDQRLSTAFERLRASRLDLVQTLRRVAYSSNDTDAPSLRFTAL